MERHFYQQTYRECEARAHELLRHGRVTIHRLEAAMTALLKLRQACCHPQVGGVTRTLQQSAMSMDDLLELMLVRWRALAWRVVGVFVFCVINLLVLLSVMWLVVRGVLGCQRCSGL